MPSRKTSTPRLAETLATFDDTAMEELRAAVQEELERENEWIASFLRPLMDDPDEKVRDPRA